MAPHVVGAEQLKKMFHLSGLIPGTCKAVPELCLPSGVFMKAGVQSCSWGCYRRGWR